MAYQGRSAAEFVDLPLVQEHIESAALDLGQSIARRFIDGTNAAMRYMTSLQFDSPLEVLFWIWWQSGIVEGACGADELNLLAQQEVIVGGSRYRLDFVIEPAKFWAERAWQPIAVEVDGHAFHERTPAQVATRDRRDRALQVAGWKVFHFSFKEFTADPLNAVAEVFIFARRQLRESDRKVALLDGK